MADPVRNEKPKPDFRLMDLNFWCRLQMISHWDIKKQKLFIAMARIDDERDYMEDMLEFLLPSKTLLISENPYDSYQEFRDPILQFEYETLVSKYPKQIDLLDLKSINIEINLKSPPFQRRRRLTTQQFQGFVEKWIKSEANPKFKTIVIHADSREVEEYYQEKILDGLLYQQLPNDWTCESFPRGPFSREYMTDNGIYEVQREADGQKAVVCFQSFAKVVLWKFFVA
ncbi:Protein CBG15781 [Caenorhabditis briggsae]|uniref:Protein CBG15781 n=1 Tax=Caenorhabditis briggsae TaxID=6238 RepID=A8XMS7_CAEBR|nr:Protein CBG15781 [Caenorhabditis briggsae]CAP33953.2 Protein CBG15781 [Caenorhabditis briggsae]